MLRACSAPTPPSTGTGRFTGAALLAWALPALPADALPWSLDALLTVDPAGEALPLDLPASVTR